MTKAKHNPDRFMLSINATQIDVADLMAAGMELREIGAIIGRSRNTVKYHVRRVYEFLGAKNRAQAAALWMKQRTSKGATHMLLTPTDRVNIQRFEVLTQEALDATRCKSLTTDRLAVITNEMREITAALRTPREEVEHVD